MRIRSIKPEFFEDEELSALPPFTRLLFIGTWLLADKHGVFENRPRLIQAKVFPYDSSAASDVSKMIPQLIQGRFLVPFEADGKDWLWIPSFTRHQRITGTESQNESRNPLPPDEIPIVETLGKQSGNTEETLGMNGARKGSGEREHGKGKEEGGRFVPPTVEEVSAYIEEKSYHFSPERFVSYYQVLNWKPKGSSVQMTNWHAACVSFESKVSVEERAAVDRRRQDQARRTASAVEAETHQREKAEADAAMARIEAMVQAPTPEILERAEAYATGATARLSQEMRLKMAASDMIAEGK